MLDQELGGAKVPRPHGVAQSGDALKALPHPDHRRMCTRTLRLSMNKWEITPLFGGLKMKTTQKTTIKNHNFVRP